MENETKHTPGPWDIVKVDCGVFKISGAFACENSANAALIASAPDLLEALRAIKAALEDGSVLTQEGIEDMHDIARAAIAKAEGKS